MASDAARMLEQCVAAPDDDEPRLVWADAIGGERGELVVLQCDLARGGLSPSEVAVRRRRERDLLARHGAAWSGLATLASRYRFHRGFVEAARVDLDVLARDAGAIVHAAPLLSGLSITNMAGAVDPATRTIARPRPAPEALGTLARVLALPALSRVEAIDIVDPGGWVDTARHRHGIVPLADDVAALLAAYGAAEHLRALGLTGGELGQRGMEALGALAEHARLDRLWLRGHRLRADDVAALVLRFPDVTAIDLSGWPLELASIAPLLERPLRSLAVSGLSLDSFAALATSAAAPTLEHVALLDCAFGASPTLPFAAFPALRSLELSSAHAMSDATIRALAASELPRLRELAIGSHATHATLDGIAERFGRQLDVLDIRGCFSTWRGRDLAGDLVTGALPPALLHPFAPPALGAEARSTRNELRGDPQPVAYLVSSDGGKVWEVPAIDEVVIASGPFSEVRVDGVALGQRAIALRWRDGAHFVQPGMPSFGTYLDEVLVHEPVRVHDGAMLRAGILQLRYFIGDGALDRVRGAADI